MQTIISPKPFDSEVLLLKIKAILKRNEEQNKESENKEFDLTSYHFNPKLRQLTHSGVTQTLSPKENELLKMLAEHLNDLLPREQALKKIWGSDTYTWQSQVMGSEHNRFQRVNSGLVYASGAGIYKYSGGPMGVVGPTADLRQHQVSAHIAANGDLVLELDLTTSTTAIVEVRAASGQLIARPFFERRASGKHTLRVPANGMAPGAVIVSLRTNEGPVSVKVMR